MIQFDIDHLIVTSPSLAKGVEYIEQTLGVTPELGGQHPRMGTHNCLLRLGEKIYLEVIAVNPDAPLPTRPRWFGLDQLHANAEPRLATWVVRTNDIHAALAASPIPLGEIGAMNRGELNWLIAIPPDGHLPAQGVVPTMIQWLNEPHPASKLHNSGYSLLRLQGFHPDVEEFAGMLKFLGFEDEFSISPHEKSHLVATIQTPEGVRQL
jgi:hypothetical protein